MSRREEMRGRIDRSIVLRVRIYALIFLVMTVVVVIDVVVIGPRAVLPAVLCLLGGALLGLVASRMFALRLDAVSGTVIGRIDALGGVILLGYVLFALFRGDLADLWFDGPMVGVASLAALAGLMAGQVVGTGRGIARALGLGQTGARST